MNRNIFQSDAACDILVTEQWENLRIEYYPSVLRVVSMDNYIKLEVFSSLNNTAFRIKLLVESVPNVAKGE